MKQLVKIIIPMLLMLVVSNLYGQIISGAPLKVKNGNGLGPLALPTLENFPRGTAFISSTEGADLFVDGGRGISPGLYWYRYKRLSPNGAPIFHSPALINSPFKSNGSIFQTPDKLVHGIWLSEPDLVHTVFDAVKLKFIEIERVSLEGLDIPKPSNVTVMLNPDGSVEAILDVPGGIKSEPRQYPSRNWTEEYDPFDGAGIWRGNLNYRCLYAVSLPGLLKGPVTKPRLISKSKLEVLMRMQQLTMVNLGGKHSRDLITGSHFGDFHYYSNNSGTGVELEQKQLLVDYSGTVLRHPTISPAVVAWPNPKSGFSDLVAGSEGAVYYYKFSGKLTFNGQPTYAAPVAVLVENADLYAGSLPVVNVVDWNGDGVLDIVAGNSEGRILYFQNTGTDDVPNFQNSTELEAGGYPIFIQPGYSGDIQGPGEARWGYVCPTVVDWDEDGDLDIVMSDATAKHTVYVNLGTPTSPKLDTGRPIYCDGLDVHGMWRIQPAAGKLGGRMAYIQVDADDKFHIYWRIDNYNIKDGGQLRLDNGDLIGCSYQFAGGTGRAKIHLADWDQDGVKDLILGTPGWLAIPNKESGYPMPTLKDSRRATVLFMKNAGTDTDPVFKHPVPFKHKGELLQPGGNHACSASVVSLGGGRETNLVVTNETGQIIIYKRENITWE